MNQVIIIGDVHLGKSVNIGKHGIGSALSSRVIDQLAILDWVLEKADEHCANDIVFTGDIFEEGKPHPALITSFIRLVKKASQLGLKVHIIRGNHDILRSGNFYLSALDIIVAADIENVFVYNEVSTINIGNSGITFAPFMDRKSLFLDSNKEAVETLDKIFKYENSGISNEHYKVMIGHLAIEGSLFVGDEIDDMANELFCPLTMFEGYDYVWMGHVHKPQILCKIPHIAHIGSMDISNFGETNHTKHIVIYDADTGNFITEKIPTRPLKKISIIVPPEITDTTSYVLEEIKKIDLKNSIVKVDINLDSTEAAAVNKGVLQKALMEQGCFNISNITETKKVKIIKKEDDTSFTHAMDPQSLIKTYAETHIEEGLRSEFISVANSMHNQIKVESK